MESVTDCFVHECGDYGGVNSTRDGADDVYGGADLFSDGINELLGVVDCYVFFGVGDVDNEVL